MRNTRTLTADWRMLYHDESGGLAIGLLPHDESADALIIPVDARYWACSLAPCSITSTPAKGATN